MIRKSHSWSLEWIRDRSANQSGPSILSLPSGQSQSRQRQAHHADARYTSDIGPRISYLSRGIRIPFAIVPVLFAIIRIRSRTFAIIRDIFTPPPPKAAQIRTPKSAFRNKFYAAPTPLSTTPHSTTVHERSTCVHEQSLNVQPFWRPPPPKETGHRVLSPVSFAFFPVFSAFFWFFPHPLPPRGLPKLCRQLRRKLCRVPRHPVENA